MSPCETVVPDLPVAILLKVTVGLDLNGTGRLKGNQEPVELFVKIDANLAN